VAEHFYIAKAKEQGSEAVHGQIGVNNKKGMKKLKAIGVLAISSILFMGIMMLGAILLSSFVTKPFNDGLVVIINNENPVSALSPDEVRVYFLRKAKNRWPQIDKNIRPVTRKSECFERDVFYSLIIEMSETEIEKYFADTQFPDDEKTLEELNSDGEIIKFVEKEIGGIGFISSKSLTPAIRSRVKVVLEL
jgi:hypothetical protein